MSNLDFSEALEQHRAPGYVMTNEQDLLLAKLTKVVENGGDVVVPDECTLQLDLDTEEQYEKFLVSVRILTKVMGLEIDSYHAAPSASGLPHRHVTVKLDSSTPVSTAEERAMAQCFLGSDPVRELLCLGNAKAGVQPAWFFFEWPNGIPDSMKKEAAHD